MDATALLAGNESRLQLPSAFTPIQVRAEVAYRKPVIEQYPQRNRAERRRAAKLARKDAVAIGGNQS